MKWRKRLLVASLLLVSWTFVWRAERAVDEAQTMRIKAEAEELVRSLGVCQ